MHKTSRLRIVILLGALIATFSYFRVFRILENSRPGRVMRSMLISVIEPVEEKLTYALRFPARVKNNMKNRQTLLRENIKLRDSLERERIKNNALKEKLKMSLKFSELESWISNHSDGETGVFADVTARNSNVWLTSLRLNKGQRESIQTGNAVLSMNGLAGKITEIFSRAATVMLLTHPSSSIGVRIERTHEAYILSGTGSGCALRFVPRDTDVRTGDTLITSGLSETIPPGIPVGKIQSIARQAEQSELAIRVEPFAAFSTIERVFVLRKSR